MKKKEGGRSDAELTGAGRKVSAKIEVSSPQISTLLRRTEMKKPICAFLILVLCFAVCACDKTAPDGINDPQTDGAPATASDLSAPDSSAPDADAGGSDSSAPTDGGDGQILFSPENDEIVWADWKTGTDFPDERFAEKYHEYGKVEIDGALRELIENAGDKRIAVLYVPFDVPEGARDPFSALPADYREKYASKTVFGDVCAMTAEEIACLVCDPDVKFGLGAVNYEEYYIAHTAYYDGACPCPGGHPYPEEMTAPPDTAAQTAKMPEK